MDHEQLTRQEQQLKNHQHSLESLLKIEASLREYSAEGISADTAQYLKQAVNAAVNPIDLRFQLSPSFESFEGTGRRYATAVTMEGVQELIETVRTNIAALETGNKN